MNGLLVMLAITCCLQVLEACEVGQAIRKGTSEGVTEQVPAGMSVNVHRVKALESG